jgi:hypothetical protein
MSYLKINSLNCVSSVAHNIGVNSFALVRRVFILKDSGSFLQLSGVWGLTFWYRNLAFKF